MNIINYLFQPIGFIVAVCVLLALSGVVILSLLRQDKELNKLGELEKKEAAARQELVKSKEETSLKDQMYNGLKGQYDELEKDVEKMAKESDGLKSEIEKLKKVPPPQKFQPSFSIPDEDKISFEIESRPKVEVKPKIEEKPKVEDKPRVEDKPKVEEKPKDPSKLDNIPNQSITNILQQIKSIDNPPKISPE